MARTKRSYQFKEGSHVSGDPNKIGKEFERLEKTEDGLTAETAIEAAKVKTSPLHDTFEWDDTAAAHQHRLKQARTLIRSVEVVIIGSNKPKRRGWVHIREGKTSKGRYEPMEVVVQEMDLFHSALEELQEKLSAAARAVAELRDAAGLSKQKGKMAIIGVVMKSLETASEAIKKLAA